MPEEPLDHEHAELKKRATRRLVVAVVLVLAAVAVLTILGRQKTATPPVATEPAAPQIAAPITPAPPAIVEAPPEVPAEATPPPEQAPAAQPAEPPPPPQVVNNQLRAAPAQKTAAPALPPATRTTSQAVVPQQPAPAAPAKPAAMPPEKPAVEAAGPKGYVVQLGVFSNFANAQALQTKLAQNGIKSYTETRVHVGPFQNKAEADQALAKIRAMGIGAVVVPAH